MKNNYRHLTFIVLFIAVVSVISGCESTKQEPVINNSEVVNFAVIGDMPYSEKEAALLTPPSGAIYQQLQVTLPEVLIHVGDFKPGGQACTNANLLASREQLLNLYPHRLVYTPGDNDWTDCDRDKLQTRFDELERLRFLKKHFFAGKGLELSRDIQGLVRQNGVEENARWQINQLLFTTLHIPGSANGRIEVLKSDFDQTLLAANQRDKNNLTWLNQAFQVAENSAAIVVAFQADIYHPRNLKYNIACSFEQRSKCDAFKLIREHITQLAKAYKKPVLVVHGDTYETCFDQPKQKTVSNLWRINALGDKNLSDVVGVIFDKKAQANPFTVASLVGQKALPTRCLYKTK